MNSKNIPKPIDVTYLEVQSKSDTSLNIAWNNTYTNKCTTNYNVTWINLKTGQVKYSINSANKLYHNITGLKACTLYEYDVDTLADLGQHSGVTGRVSKTDGQVKYSINSANKLYHNITGLKACTLYEYDVDTLADLGQHSGVTGRVSKTDAVIEDKRTSFSVLMAKKKSWQYIADGFDSYADVTSPQLKKWWENEKARSKKLLTTESRRRMATGEGPFTPGESTDPELEAILSTPIAYSVEGTEDCDTVLPPTQRPEESSATQSPPEAAIPTISGSYRSYGLAIGYMRVDLVKLSSRPVVDQTLTTKQRTGKAMVYNRKYSPFPLSLHVKRWNHLNDDGYVLWIILGDYRRAETSH
uniref:Fibronectin type-III domain-containing protein n=1 Tax=Timema tahoe TaxID=61484 RepID=A0A7R9ILK9_9NEOP|nr:unnamed protein product [Timema tahoe]